MTEVVSVPVAITERRVSASKRIEALERSRAQTLALVSELDDATLSAWPSPDFSPIGWHLGHIAFTEAFWISGRCASDDSLWQPWTRAFSQSGRPKHERTALPSRSELLGYLREVRQRSLDVLARTDFRGADPVVREEFVSWFVECHEHQHRETIAMVLAMHRIASFDRVAPSRRGAIAGDDVPAASHLPSTSSSPTVRVPESTGPIGTDDPLSYDNERPSHLVALPAFEIDQHPVTCGEWLAFVLDGGYRNRGLYDAAGWKWMQRHAISAPLDWRRDVEGALVRVGINGPERLELDAPVTGVSWYEATAYAAWRGARLPTEYEWERVARAGAASETPWLDLVRRAAATVRASGSGATDMIGNVWEWTASSFAPYDGFAWFPYREYSEPWFDGKHRVLRGGSFATSHAIARPTFRNWYVPTTRLPHAGLRCVVRRER